MLSEVLNCILDIGILVVLLKFVFKFECSSKGKVHHRSQMKISTHNTCPNISNLRCNDVAIKLVLGIVGLWIMFSVGINNTGSASLAAVFVFVLLSALCDVLEFVRIIPERNRIGNFVISFIYFFIGIFFLHNYDEQMTMYSLNMCMAFVCFFCAILVALEFDIFLPHWFVDTFHWLFIIGILCVLFLLAINYKITYYPSIALCFIKIFVITLFIVLNLYHLECDSDISTNSKEDFLTAVLVVDDVSQSNNENSVNKRELACTTNKKSGGSSFSEKVSHTEEQGDGLQINSH